MSKFREFKEHLCPEVYRVSDYIKKGERVTIKYKTDTDTKSRALEIKKIRGEVISLDNYITTIKMKNYCMSFNNNTFMYEWEKA